MKRRPVAPLLLLATIAVVAAWWLFRRPPVHSIRHVVLVSIDTCRADRLSCYGFGEPTTPNIDAVTRDGVRFENAIAPVPMTLASHSTMLTGTDPLYHGVHDNLDFRLGPSNRTLAEILKDQGFTTAAFVSTFVLDAQFGLDQGFDTYDDEVVRSHADAHANERKAADTTKAALAWLDAHGRDPFFLFLHYYDPHMDYEPPAAFRSKFTEPYAGEIAYADHALGQVIERLKTLGLYESTLIVITSDHGEMLGEHGERTHTYYIYQSALHVPLIFKLPAGVERKGPAQEPGLVGIVDIVPTICGLLGIEAPEAVAGEDLTDVLLGRSDAAARRHIYCESFTPLRYGANSLLGLVGERWKLIQTTRPELYDLAADPAESNNLAASRPEELRLAQGRLRQLLHDQVRADADSDIRTDTKAIQRLETIGYIAGGHLSVDTGYDQDPKRDDPKDLIGFHRTNGEVNGFLALKQYDKAEALCTKMLDQRPDFAHALVNLGRITIARGDFQGAVVHLDKALKIDPLNADARNRLGTCHARLGNAAEAIAQFNQAIALDAGFADAHNNLGVVLMNKGEVDEAIDHYRQALRIRPDYADAHLNLGMVLDAIGESTKAMDHLQEAARLDPGSFQARSRVARVLAAGGRMADAIDHLEAAVGLRREDPQVRFYLAKALAMSGRSAEALGPLAEAIRLNPDWAAALNARAWILATHADEKIRDPQEALRLASRAAELTQRRDAATLDTLAAAEAAAGDHAAAAKTAREAIERATSANEGELAEEIRQRMKLYDAGGSHVESR